LGKITVDREEINASEMAGKLLHEIVCYGGEKTIKKQRFYFQGITSE
jgi:hypothetical protein